MNKNFTQLVCRVKESPVIVGTMERNKIVQCVQSCYQNFLGIQSRKENRTKCTKT